MWRRTSSRRRGKRARSPLVHVVPFRRTMWGTFLTSILPRTPRRNGIWIHVPFRRGVRVFGRDSPGRRGAERQTQTIPQRGSLLRARRASTRRVATASLGLLPPGFGFHDHVRRLSTCVLRLSTYTRGGGGLGLNVGAGALAVPPRTLALLLERFVHGAGSVSVVHEDGGGR